MSSTELRVDSADGNPYTHDSFLETYSDGEEKWKAASIWKSDGTIRIRTAPVSDVVEVAPMTRVNTSLTPPYFDENNFPTIGNPVTNSSPHYSQVLIPQQEERKNLSPVAHDFEPGASKHILNYSAENCSTNEEFETLPSGLWDGNESFPQPLTDESTDRIDWQKMISTWTHEQWREFGIKYFYGYIQQSTILMGQIPYNGHEESNIGSWGDA